MIIYASLPYYDNGWCVDVLMREASGAVVFNTFTYANDQSRALADMAEMQRQIAAVAEADTGSVAESDIVTVLERQRRRIAELEAEIMRLRKAIRAGFTRENINHNHDLG